MRKLLVLPLMLVAMPCAFALNTNPITSSYGELAAMPQAVYIILLLFKNRTSMPIWVDNE